MPTIPLTLPAVFGSSFSLPFNPDVGSLWDIGLNGVGYLLSTLDQESPFEYRAFTIQGVARQKPRIDDSAEPGEQTLEPWWARAQHSWHLGRDQKILDSENSDRFKFLESRGIDIWEEGQLSLLKDTYLVTSGAHSDYKFLTDGSLFLSEDGNLWKIPDPDDHPTSSTSSGVGGPGLGVDIASMTSDGQFVYVCWVSGTSGIRKIPIAAFTGDTLVNDLEPNLIKFAKGRLLAAKGASLYECDLAVTAEPDPFFTEQATWTWTSISESGPGVYFSGHSGDRSEVYLGRLTNQDLAFLDNATIGALRSVWQAPEGERILGIRGFLGRGLLIGTDKGLRIATVSSGEGDLDVSALLVEDAVVRDFSLQGKFAWFTWEQFDATRGGVGRVDLGTLAVASDLMYATQQEITSVVDHGGRLFFTYDGGAVGEHPTDLVESGFLETGEIRFGTFENKRIYWVDMLVAGNGSFDFNIRVNNGTYDPYLSGGVAVNTSEGVNVLGTRYGVKWTLYRDGVDPTDGPTFYEYRLRAEPQSPGRARYFLPIMVYDQVITKNGRVYGHAGQARDWIRLLKLLYVNTSRVLIQRPFDPVGQGVMCDIEGFEFKEYAPPRAGFEGFGGIALIIAKEAG